LNSWTFERTRFDPPLNQILPVGYENKELEKKNGVGSHDGLFWEQIPGSHLYFDVCVIMLSVRFFINFSVEQNFL
jgi:hypothetical protein